ncbi:unnamed protein product [Cyprideis torosa]|uniref:Uncharacterized protein n=1 Tax=Cyprideis torosa TaxID=163714 RepID=A0A7R8ZH20_9CRUS|nr:unnamed protein product [Cyprideis torosa]CAG0882670.1 unnamed protein product [Cyprideis torosa]
MHIRRMVTPPGSVPEVARYMYAFCQNEYFSSTAEAPLAGDVPNALLTVSTLLFSIDAFLERLITSVASAFPISSPWINTSSPFPMPQPARETSSNPTTDDVEEPRRRLSQWTGFLWDIHCRLLSGSGDHSWRTRDPMELLRCHTFCFHPDYVFPMPQEIPQEFRNEIRLLRLRDILLLSRRLIHTFRIAFDGYPIVSMYPASLENCMNALRDSVRALIHTSCFLSTLSRVRRDATDNERYMNQICSLLERLEPHLYRTLPVLPISRIPQVVGSHRPETLAVSSESDDVVFNNPQAGIQGRRVGDRVVFEAVPVPLSSYVSTTVYSRPTRTSTSNFNSDRTMRQSGVRQPALRQVRVILDRMMFDDMPLFTNRAFEVQCLNYRVQKWDLIHHDFFLGFREPSMRVVCSGVKLHNDNSVSISQDETKLAAITRTENRNLYELSVFSLSERSLGHKLHSLPVFSSAVSVAFSPSGNYIAVGLATARLVYVGGMPSMAQAMADVYKLGTPLKRNHCNKVDTEHDYDGPSSFKKSSSLLWVRELTRPQSPGSARNLSLNAIQWLPTAGHGFVYGTNRGEVIMLS